MDQQERLPSVRGDGEAAGKERTHADSKSGDAQPQVLDAVDGDPVESGDGEAKGEEASATRFAVVALADQSAYAGQAAAGTAPKLLLA